MDGDQQESGTGIPVLRFGCLTAGTAVTLSWGLLLRVTLKTVFKGWCSVASAQLGFFFGFFVTENAVIDLMVRKMVINIAPLYTFQIKKILSKYMQPILKYSKNNMWFF